MVLSNIDLSLARLRETRFENSKCIGVDWSKAEDIMLPEAQGLLLGLGIRLD